MAISTYSSGNLNPTNVYASRELLERISPWLAIDPFVVMKTCPMNSTDTVLFSRSVIPDSDLNPSLEGINKASRQFVLENYSVQLQEFEESYAFSSKEIELGEFGNFIINEAKNNLSDYVKQVREEYAWTRYRAGDNVFYNTNAITSRAAVNGAMTLGLVDKAISLLEANRAPYIQDAAVGAMQQGTVPMPPAYIALGHTDLKSDFRRLAGFREAVEIPGRSKASEYWAGSVRNLDVLLTPHFKPFLGAGASVGATGMRSVGGSNVDVYPIIIFSKNSLGRVSLKGSGKGGYGNFKINALSPDQLDKSDPTGKRGYVSARWYDAALILRQQGVVRLEVGSTANPV